MKATERFSDRVENYIKYRPHYPKEILPFLEEEIGLTSSSIIADIGSGTGISAEMFLRNRNTVYGVEPNKEMREAAEKLLKAFPNFHSINAASEATTLKDCSIDIIIAAQAFHWFDVQAAKKEFQRILKPGGWVVLIWNNRETDTTPFLKAYEKLLNTYGTDYKEVNHVNVRSTIVSFFGNRGFTLKLYPNIQAFDYKGLQGRLLSSSYTPSANDPGYQPMLEELRKIFEEFQQDNAVIFGYKTEVFYGQI